MAQNMQSVYVPVNVFGKTRLVMQSVTADPREAALVEAESARIAEVNKRRLYKEGEQYADENLLCAQAEGINPATQRLPEHKRRHAYSTEIGESVDYLADRLGEGWSITSTNTEVQAVIDDLLTGSDQLSAVDEDGTRTASTDDSLREAMTCGDVAAYVAWDAVNNRPVAELWESEKVDFRWSDTKTIEKVIRTELVWRMNSDGMWVQVAEHAVYEMAMNPVFARDCRVQVFWDDEEFPRSTSWLGVGRIPWQLLRADTEGLRATRGRSLISDQVMEAADRLNACLQCGFLITRYNSHGTLAVIGDAASLKVESNSGAVHKDVADVLTFPGGTALSQIDLSGDATMLKHQVETLKDEIVGAFGLARVDATTWSGLGGVTGYALEILNTKTEATFKRIRRQWRKDWTSFVNLVLDVTAWKRAPAGFIVDGQFVASDAALANPLDLANPEVIPMTAFWTVQPSAVFADRQVEVRMGTGYIVDHVQNRDDFVANLISREEALRRDGLDDIEIGDIVDEIKANAPPTEGALFGQSSNPSTAAGGSLSVVTA